MVWCEVRLTHRARRDLIHDPKAERLCVARYHRRDQEEVNEYPETRREQEREPNEDIAEDDSAPKTTQLTYRAPCFPEIKSVNREAS